MTETRTDHGALATWTAEECPFAIEYLQKALDDIRLAVVDAFFSLPRGGAEIGGILLGRVEEQRVQILDYSPIECEHAFGPAFTLSPTDQTRLADALGQTFPGGLRPVGWYHSHTRSEIALTDTDLEIHNRFFPDRWQVALVLRPSTLQPTQAGFFFREPDGSIHAQSSYHQFVVEALPLQQIPSNGAQAVPGSMRETEPEAVVMTLDSAEPRLLAAPPTEAHEAEQYSEQPALTEPESHAEPVVSLMRDPEPLAEPAVAPAHEPEPSHEVEAPSVPVSYGSSESPEEASHIEDSESQHSHEEADHSAPFVISHDEHPKPRRGWIGIAAGILAGMLLGVGADQARTHSQTPVRSAPAPAVTQRQAPAPESATLRSRADNLARQVADLTQQNSALRKQNDDLAKQQADSTKQQSELSKQQADAGKQQTELRQQRDDLVKQTAKLKADLTAQTARAQSLQQQLDDLRRQQQRRRLSIQSADPLP